MITDEARRISKRPSDCKENKSRHSQGHEVMNIILDVNILIAALIRDSTVRHPAVNRYICDFGHLHQANQCPDNKQRKSYQQ